MEIIQKKMHWCKTGLIFICLFLIASMFTTSTVQAEVYFDAPPSKDWNTRDLMRMTVLATGQSDCMVLDAGGEVMMIDGGADPFRDKLKAYFDGRGATHFKYLLNTHFHDDHINGLYWLMYFGFKADEFLTPYNEKAFNYSKLQKRAIKQAEKSNIPVRQVFNGDELTLGDANLKIFRYEEATGTNGKSLMIRVTFGDASMILGGDIIGTTQHWFLKNLPPDALKADIIKVPHHGVTPMVSSFLDAVNPSVVVMTTYEKRVTKSKTQVNSRKIPTYYSGDGIVILETDGTDWYITQEEKNQIKNPLPVGLAWGWVFPYAPRDLLSRGFLIP